jgi:hypothetical protein
MEVKEEGLIAAASGFTQNNRVTGRRDDFGLVAVLVEHFGHQLGAFLNTLAFSRNTGLGTEARQLVDEKVNVLLDMGINAMSDFVLGHLSFPGQLPVVGKLATIMIGFNVIQPIVGWSICNPFLVANQFCD